MIKKADLSEMAWPNETGKFTKEEKKTFLDALEILIRGAVPENPEQYFVLEDGRYVKTGKPVPWTNDELVAFTTGRNIIANRLNDVINAGGGEGGAGEGVLVEFVNWCGGWAELVLHQSSEAMALLSAIRCRPVFRDYCATVMVKVKAVGRQHGLQGMPGGDVVMGDAGPAGGGNAGGGVVAVGNANANGVNAAVGGAAKGQGGKGKGKGKGGKVAGKGGKKGKGKA